MFLPIYQAFLHSRLYILNFENDSIGLQKAGGETCQHLATYDDSSGQFSTQTWHNITIYVKDGNIKVYLNDNLCIDYTDNPFISYGTIGVETGGSAYFDDCP